MDTKEEYFMKGTASAKALRFESQCEQGGDASREGMGTGQVVWGGPQGRLGFSPEGDGATGWRSAEERCDLTWMFMGSLGLYMKDRLWRWREEWETRKGTRMDKNQGRARGAERNGRFLVSGPLLQACCGAQVCALLVLRALAPCLGRRRSG